MASEFQVGDAVEYWTMAREGEPSGSGKITYLGILGGHTPVAWIEGARGCIALTHVRKINEPPPRRERKPHAK